MSVSLESRVDELQRQIDGLQALAWYDDPSVIVAVVAVLLSLLTAAISCLWTLWQQRQGQRQELRALLQRLAQLPRENIENLKKYESDPAAMNAVGGLINQENTLLAQHAAELANKLPSRSVSAVECFSIGLALQSAYDLDRASEFFERARRSAKDFNTGIAAIRLIAKQKFLRGQAEAGRAEFRNALAIFDRYPGYDPFTRISTQIQTELAWAESEASLSGPAGAALQHIASAERLLAEALPGPGSAWLAGLIRQAKAVMSAAGLQAGGKPLP